MNDEASTPVAPAQEITGLIGHKSPYKAILTASFYQVFKGRRIAVGHRNDSN